MRTIPQVIMIAEVSDVGEKEVSVCSNGKYTTSTCQVIIYCTPFKCSHSPSVPKGDLIKRV